MNYKDKEWLIEKLNQYGSGSQIAKNEGYPVTCVNRYIRKYNLQSNRFVSSAQRKYKMNERYFKEIDTEEKAYWLGFFVADGCLYHGKTSYDIQFTLKSCDIDILEKFKKAIDSDQKIKEKNSEEIFFRVSSKSMFNDLNKHGVTVRKTGKETFPNIEEKLIRHFIRGYFDGDGCFTQDLNNYIKGSFHIICANKDFLEEISQHLKHSIGVKLNVKEYKKVFYIRTNSTKKCIKIYNYIYKKPKVSLNRKYNKVKEFLNKYSPKCK